MDSSAKRRTNKREALAGLLQVEVYTPWWYRHRFSQEILTERLLP
jgi:hypothetical protein